MASHRYCQHCGTPFQEAQRFCEHCGSPVDDATRDRPQPQNPRQPGFPLAACVLLMVSVAGSGLYAWTELSRMSSESASHDFQNARCQNVVVEAVSSRFGAKAGEFGSEDGILNLSNGVGLYLYRSLRLRQSPGWGLSAASEPINLTDSQGYFRPLDPVQLCLEYTPPACPPGDERGRIYSIVNRRTGVRVDGHYGRNSCGGA